MLPLADVICQWRPSESGKGQNRSRSAHWASTGERALSTSQEVFLAVEGRSKTCACQRADFSLESLNGKNKAGQALAQGYV